MHVTREWLYYTIKQQDDTLIVMRAHPDMKRFVARVEKFEDNVFDVDNIRSVTFLINHRTIAS